MAKKTTKATATPATTTETTEVKKARKPRVRKAKSPVEVAEQIATEIDKEETAKPKVKRVRKAKAETVEAPKAEKAPKAKAKKVAAPEAPAKVDGLKKPQVRILAALAAAPHGLTRKEVSDNAPVDNACCTEYLGSLKEDVRIANDVKHFPSLIGLGFVTFDTVDQDGKDVVVYKITAAGKKAAK